MRRLILILCCLCVASSAFAGKGSKNCTPAERRRSCVWSESFFSQATVEANEGTLVNAPTVNQSVTLNGTTQYISFAPTGREVASDNLSFVVDFIPTFAADAAGTFTLLTVDNVGSTATNLIRKITAETGLSVYFHNSEITVTYASFSPYWLQNQRNVIVAAHDGAKARVYLNGNEIYNANHAVSASSDNVTFLDVGWRTGTGHYFAGVINSVKVFKSTLSQSEALAYYNQDMFKWEADITANYLMDMQSHDVANSLLLDKSGNGYDLDFSAVAPTKLVTKHGYYFDAVDTYFEYPHVGGADPFIPAGDFSVAILFKPDVNTGGSKYIAGKYSGAGNRCWLFYQSADDVIFIVHTGAVSTTRTYASVLEPGRLTFIVGTYNYITSGTSIVRLYVKSGLVNSFVETNTAVGPCNQGSILPFVLGAAGNYISEFPGGIYEAMYLDGTVLNEMQVEDVYIQMMQRLNSN